MKNPENRTSMIEVLIEEKLRCTQKRYESVARKAYRLALQNPSHRGFGPDQLVLQASVTVRDRSLV